MEDDDFSPGTLLGCSLDPVLDFACMNDWWLDSYWFQSTNGDEVQSISESELINQGYNQNALTINSPSAAVDCGRSEEYLPESVNRAETGPKRSLMERLCQALDSIIKYSAGEEDVLIQVWVPVSIAGSRRRVLTTDSQPFSGSARLQGFREISVRFQFATDENSSDASCLGMPGRVFFGKVPEWTPDVRFFSRDEYARVEHAHLYNVCGSLALPVFEGDNFTCLGVIELVITTQKINYRPEIECVRNALQAVDLRSSEIFIPHDIKGDGGYEWHSQMIIPEIKQIIESAGATHQFPLVQTWVPCIQQGKGGSRHSDSNYASCISTVESACYVGDARLHAFHVACSDHHLFKGQGVAGRAFLTNHPSFSPDVTRMTKTEYPLSHHARVFGLHAAVAVRMQSIYSGATDYVLEFFLPFDCVDRSEQTSFLDSLPIIIRQGCKSLFLISEENVGDEWKDMQTQAKSENDGKELHLPEGYLRNGNHRRRSKMERSITPEILQQYFAGNLKDAARSLGVCTTTLKRICRQHGIKRWPCRKIKKVGHSLQKLQLVMDSVQCSSHTIGTGSFYPNFPKLPSCTTPRPQEDQHQNNMTRKDSPSSGASSSGHYYSSREDLPVNSNPAVTYDDAIAENCISVSKMSCKDSVEHGASAEDRLWRVKVSLGSEKVRFRMKGGWCFEDLQSEIMKRFSLEDRSFRVKYLDDDSEWILLNSDADLEECIDTCMSSGVQTIKLSIYV